MSSAGNPNPPDRRLAWVLLALAVIGVLLALYIGTQVLGVLMGIVMPPEPPLPAGAVELSHSSAAHGQDDWVYRLPLDACAALAFYEQRGGRCNARPGCAGSTCSGDILFSIFALRWQAGINTTGDQTRLELSRQISWTGILPPIPPTLKAQDGS